jgi:hypothetical protein
MALRTLLITALLAQVPVQAQVPSTQKSPGSAAVTSQAKSQDLEAQKLADQAATLPPELKADAFIRIAEAKSLTQSIKQKKRLLGEAFDSAMRAKYEALPIALTNRSTDSDVGVLVASVGQGLDRLSLQTRVVSAMASIDIAEAEGFLRQIVISGPKPLTCDDLIDYQPTLFYEAAGRILKNEPLPAKQRALAEWLVGTVHYPMELEPALRAVRGSPLSDAVKTQLFSDIAVRMGAMKIDSPRTTSEAMNFGLSQAVFDALGSEKEIGAQTLLVASFRQFITSNIGLVCSDDNWFVERVKRIWLLLGEKPEGTPGEDAPKLDINPEVVNSNGRVYLFWEQNGSKELMAGYRYLSDAKERDKPEWDPQLQIFLDQFRHWQQETHEPDAARFSEICIIYAALLEIVPPGDSADRVMAEYVSFLQSSSVLFDDPPLWDMQVARLIHTCCANPKTRDIHKYFSPQTPIGVIATLDVGLRPQPSTTGAQPK